MRRFHIPQISDLAGERRVGRDVGNARQRAAASGRAATSRQAKHSYVRQGLCACVFWWCRFAAASAQSVDPIADAGKHNQLNLAGDGRSFLIREASRASFTVIGGLHGDKETPALVQDLFGALQHAGYRYLATEMSPWAASRIPGSHRNLWGCDIEEMHPELIIRLVRDGPALALGLLARVLVARDRLLLVGKAGLIGAPSIKPAMRSFSSTRGSANPRYAGGLSTDASE